MNLFFDQYRKDIAFPALEKKVYEGLDTAFLKHKIIEIQNGLQLM